MKKTSQFHHFARKVSRWTGHPWAFGLAVGTIFAWALTGPLFHFSDTWQLVINTSTTVVTFLMVFLIQNTQNRDAEAMQVKLDELLRAIDKAHNALLDLEELDEEDLDKIRRRYVRLAEVARVALQRGELDQGTPELLTENESEREE